MNIMIGDSITAWNPRKDVINYGVPGDTTTNILWRVDTIQVSDSDVVIIMAGVNDIIMNIPDDRILANYRDILEYLSPKNKNIIVLSILPIAGEKKRNSSIIRLNNEIENMCKRRNIEFLGIHSRFSDEKGWLDSKLTTDGIHLSTKGYELLNSIIDSLT